MGQFNPLDLTGKNILVTGASSGIGRASAIYLSKLGAHIILTGRDLERLEATWKYLNGEGHHIIPCDLSESNNIEALFKEIVYTAGKLNGLVNCAGIPYIVPLNVLTTKHMEDIMRTNFFPFIEMARLYGKKKYSEGGSIVTISSILTLQPRANETGYITSKGAMNSAVGSLACELASRSIRVNGIICGNIFTEMVKKTVDQLGNDNHLQSVIDNSLLGMGKPEDIASVVAFLISDMSRFITGRNLYADGGLL